MKKKKINNIKSNTNTKACGRTFFRKKKKKLNYGKKRKIIKIFFHYEYKI